MKVAVVGGGLAGIAAALELSSGDTPSCSPRPGRRSAAPSRRFRSGRATPVLRPTTDSTSLSGCCTAYLDFIAEIGQAQSIAPHAARAPCRRRGRQRRYDPARSRWPPALRAHEPRGTLGDREGRAQARGASTRPHTTARRSAPCSAGSGQSQAGIDRFWDVFIRPGAESRHRRGQRRTRDLHRADRTSRGRRRERPAASSRAARGHARRGRRRRARTARRGGLARRRGSEPSTSSMQTQSSSPSRQPRAHGCSAKPEPGLEDSPIVSVHLLFDRPILRFPLAALLGSDAHWLFDRGALTGHPPERGQYVTVVSSGAPELLELRGRALIDELAGQIVARLGRAEVLWSRVSREPAATFAARPGTAACARGLERGGRTSCVRARGRTRGGRRRWRARSGAAARPPVCSPRPSVRKWRREGAR